MNELVRTMTLEIVSGHYHEGERLPRENELSRLYDVSRASVRAVLQALAGKGLVVVEPKKGIRVPPQGDWDLLDGSVLESAFRCSEDDILVCQLLTLRMVLEPVIVALAAVQASGQDIADLELAFRRMGVRWTFRIRSSTTRLT